MSTRWWQAAQQRLAMTGVDPPPMSRWLFGAVIMIVGLAPLAMRMMKGYLRQGKARVL